MLQMQRERTRERSRERTRNDNQLEQGLSETINFIGWLISAPFRATETVITTVGDSLSYMLETAPQQQQQRQRPTQIKQQVPVLQNVSILQQAQEPTTSTFKLRLGPFTTKKEIENLVDRSLRLTLEQSAIPNKDVIITIYQLRNQVSSNFMAPCISVQSPSDGEDNSSDGSGDDSGGGGGGKGNRDRIIAAIISALLVSGGVAIVMVSGGLASPGLVLAQSVLINAGVSSAVLNYSLGDNFTWSEWGKGLAKNVAITLITFTAGFVCGAISGVALTGVVSEATVRGVGAIAGGLAGAGIHSGVYVLECRMKNGEITWYELTLSGLGGALSGASAGYLGASVAQKWFPSSAESRTALMTVSDNQNNQFTLHTDNNDEKLKTVISNVQKGELKVDTVERIINNSNMRSVNGSFGHSDIHVLDFDPVLNELSYTDRGNMKSSLFISSEQQTRLVHEALQNQNNLSKLQELIRTGSVNIKYTLSSSKPMLLTSGNSVIDATIDYINITLRKTGEGFLHIVTAYPV